MVPALVPATPRTGVTVIVGIPVAPAFRMPPFAVVISPITLVDDEYSIRLIVVVAGQVVVLQAGVVLAPL